MKSLSGQRRALPSSGVEQPGETASEKDAHLLESTVGPASPEQQAALKEGKLAWIFARSTRLAAFENEGSVTLIVERIGSLSQELSVDYTTEDDTATAGEDLVKVVLQNLDGGPGSVYIGPGLLRVVVMKIL